MKHANNRTFRRTVSTLAGALAVAAGLALSAPLSHALLGDTTSGNAPTAVPLESVSSGWQTVSPYTGETYTHSSQTAGTTLSHGIDVARWQGDIDWNAVVADGVEFAILRCGYTGTGSTFKMRTDEKFTQNIEGATAAGLPVGIYYFSQATTVEEAQQEADKTIALLEPYRDKITLPVYFDWEVADSYRVAGVSQSVATDAAVAWMERVRNAGYDVGYYGSVLSLPELFDLYRLRSAACWVARYAPAVNTTLPHTLWQYTKSGTVKGIKAPVDCSFGYNFLNGNNAPTTPSEDQVLGYLEVTGNLHLRAGPGSGYDSVTILPAGAIVMQIGEAADGWVEVRYINEEDVAFTGYCSTKYVKEAEGVPGDSNGDSSNDGSGEDNSGGSSGGSGEDNSGDSSGGGSVSVSGSAVTTGKLYLRSGAGKEHTALTVIPKGTRVALIERTENGWYKLSFTDAQGQKWTGYASGKYLQLLEDEGSGSAPSPDATFSAVTTAPLNLRSGPGTDYSVVTVLPEGATVTVLNKGDGTWYQVRYTSPRGGSWTGYVSAKYLKTVPTEEEGGSDSSGSTGTAHTTGSLNLRSGPGTGYDILTVLPKGATVTVVEVGSNGWNKVTYTNSKGTRWTGWCSAKYLASGSGSSSGSGGSSGSSGASTAVTTASLNLRSGPSASYSVVTVLPSGATVTVLGKEDNGWYKVSYTKSGTTRTGYVNGKYLKLSAASGGSGSSGGNQSSGTAVSYTASTTASLNLRSGPGASYKVVTVLPKGAAVKVSEELNSGWRKVSYTKSGTTWTGYVNGKYLKKSETSGSSGSSGGSSVTTTAVSYTATTTASLNLRSGPGTGYSAITVLPDKAAVKVTEEVSNGWRKVSYTRSGTTWTGYVNGKYLKKSTASGGTSSSGSTNSSGSSGATSGGSPAALSATTNGTLNLRSGPGTEYAAVTVLHDGAEVSILATESNGWCKISYTTGGKTWTGYLNGKYLTFARVRTMTTTGILNLRSGPGLDYAALTVVANGSVVTVPDDSNPVWYKITYTDKVGGQWTGYLGAKYLK